MGDLIKWRGQDLNALVERWRNVQQIEAPRPVLPSARSSEPEIWTPLQAAPASFTSGAARVDHPVIELPRWCAVHDELWLARYDWQDGEYRFFTSAELPQRQQSRYAQDNVVMLPAGFETGAERCACCLTWTPGWADGGAVLDEKGCGKWICFGRVSPSRFFRCRDSCGSTGQLLQDGPAEKIGLLPGRGPRGKFRTQF